MTSRQAKAELNHIYGMVSSDIQRALDFALEELDHKSDKELFDLYVRFFSEESKEISNFLKGVSANIQNEDRSKYIDEWINIMMYFEHQTEKYKKKKSTEQSSDDNKT